MRKIRWGVLSTANIGMKKVLPAMQRGEYCSVEAIASRDLAKARAAAAELGIPKAYGSYEELLADPQIEAIYNPMPNHLHVPWSIKAIEGGVSGPPSTPRVELSLDTTSGQNGQKAYLTVKVLQQGKTKTELVTIVSTANNVPHYMPILIGTP